MARQPKNVLQPQERVASQLKVRAQALLWTATSVAVAVALFLLITDITRLYQAHGPAARIELSRRAVAPGGWLSASVELPVSPDRGLDSFSLNLPTTIGCRYIPGSLELKAGSLEGAQVGSYAGSGEFAIRNIPAQAGPLQIEILVEIPRDLALIGQSFRLEAVVGGATTSEVIPAIRIHAPELSVQPEIVATADEGWAYEIMISNPQDGLDFGQTDKPLVLDLKLPAAQQEHLITSGIQVLAQNVAPAMDLNERRLRIPLPALLPGQGASVFVPFRKEAPILEAQARLSYARHSLAEVTTPIATPFPVGLATMKGEIREDRLLLRWQVNQERNNRGFRIEHSQDGTHFEPLAFIPGSEDHQSHKTYQFESERLAQGRHLFRLRQESQEGTSVLTRQLEFYVGVPYPATISHTSISAREGAYFQCTLQKGQPMVMLLTSQSGQPLRVLYEGNMQSLTPYDIFVDASELPPGWYNLELRSPAGIIHEPLQVEG